MGLKRGQLTEKHWKALELISAGELSIKQVAIEVGWTPAYLYDIYNGNIEKTSQVTELFQAELRKIEKKHAEEISKLTKVNKKLALTVMNDFLQAMYNKKSRNDDDVKLTTTVMNCLNKATPNVEIGSLSYNYTKGMSPEELIYEFQRLKTLASASLIAGRVRSTESGGPGEICISPED